MDLTTRKRVQLCTHLTPQVVGAAGIRPDSCVLQSRIMLDVLDHFHIPAVEIPVTVIIYNPAYKKNLDAGVEIETEEQLEAANKADGSHSIGLGYGAGKGYAGHLIVGNPDLHWIGDPSIEQANRPQHDIELQPICAEMSAEFFAKQGTDWIVVNRCALGYRRIDNEAYKKGGDWYAKNRRHDLVGQIIRLMKKAGV